MAKKPHMTLDSKDKKIVRELDKNARQSFSTIAKKTGLSKQLVSYRINKLVDDGFIKQFISFIDIRRLGYTFYDLFLKLKHYSKEEERIVIQKIKAMPEVGWFVSTRGECKLVICLMAKDPFDFNTSLEKILSTLGNKVIGYDFFIVLDAYQLPYKEVLDTDRKAYPEQTYLGKKEEIILRDQDLKVLSRLARDARVTMNVLAEQCGLTLEMVRHSMRKLEKSGLIQAHKPLLDVAKAGYSWHIMLMQLKYAPDSEKEKLLNFLKSQSQVFYIVKGVGNWSLMVEFHTNSSEDFERVHDRINSEFEDIINDETVLQITTEHKCTFFPENCSL